MLIYITFLRKEMIEILQNKKILVYLCMSMFLPLAINIIATNSPISLDILAPLYVVMSACVISELIKVSLVEEFRLSTFDNLLIASFKKDYLIYYKTTIQVLFSFVATVFGLLLSDAFLIFIPNFNYFVTMTTFYNIIVAFVSSSVCGWISYYLFIRTRNVSSTTHTISLGIIMVTLGGIAIISNIYNIAIIIIFGAMLLILAYICSKIILTSPQPLKKRSSRQWFCFFEGQNLTFISAIIVKDLAVIRISNVVEVCFYIFAMFITKIPLVFYGILFLLTTFGARKLFYQSIVEEKLNKTNDILQLQKSKSIIFMAKAIVPTICSMLLSLIAIALSSRTISDLCFALTISILAPVVTYPITLFVKRPKEISIGSLILSIALLCVYVIIFLIKFAF